MDTAFRVDFELCGEEELDEFHSPQLMDKLLVDVHMENRKPLSHKLFDKTIGKAIEKAMGVPDKRPEMRPVMAIKVTASNEAQLLLRKLGLWNTPLLPTTKEWRGLTIGEAIEYTQKGAVGNRIMRNNLHDLNLVEEEVVGKLRHLKEVIESHSTDRPKSHEI